MYTKEKQPVHELDRMLRFLKLDKYYESGQGDWLTYADENGVRINVLDVVGSYGINLLGHNNPSIQKLLHSFNEPCFVQGSYQPYKTRLSQKLADLTAAHTGIKGWHIEYASGGAEIIEVALKLCWLQYERKLNLIRQEIYYSINYLEQKNACADDIKFFTSQLACTDIVPAVAHFEGSFHGKTLGALSVMGNAQLKNTFPVALKPLTLPKDAEALKKNADKNAVTYFVIDEKTDKIVEKKYLPVIGLFVEPVQGEAGVLCLDDALLLQISELKKIWGLPVVADEIQCGLYRTGYFSCLDRKILIADIYCFGKALGAGIAKLSTLCCSDEMYTPNFFQFHSSSFAGDAFSSKAALLFMESFEENDVIARIQENWMYRQLSVLKNIFSEYVLDIRGKGLMCAIELNEDRLHNSFITKFFKDIGMLGYWIASVLLNRERIRVLPTLSNPLSFRIQSSIQFSEEDGRFLINGFSKLFNAIESQDLQYLFGHILSFPDNAVVKHLPDAVKYNEFPENAAVFICHPIDNVHIRRIVDLIDGYDEHTLTAMLEELSTYQKFTVYHTDTLTNADGTTIPVVFLGIPLTSLSFFHLLRRGNRYEWVKKIQDAVNLATQKNARSIGLGQFTSIITKNGMHLYSPHATLTTGNTYTAILAMQAAFQQYKRKTPDRLKPAVCVVGAKGNIISSIAEEMIQHARKLILVYRHALEKDNDTWHHYREFLRKVSGSSQLAKKITTLLDIYNIDIKFDEIIAQLGDDIIVTNSLCHEAISSVDIIFTGTNDTNALLLKEHVNKGVIIVDIAVPPNVCNEIQHDNDYVYIKGGIASLPRYAGMMQRLESVILPFGKGECFACMAETFGLAFSLPGSANFTGEISAGNIRKISCLMKKEGFGLKRVKVENSV
ncbi:MAG: aminotransferase class III-fold pyridoxal phosphate-dependent enzyme [Agriterribacter sp.]